MKRYASFKSAGYMFVKSRGSAASINIFFFIFRQIRRERGLRKHAFILINNVFLNTEQCCVWCSCTRVYTIYPIDARACLCYPALQPLLSLTTKIQFAKFIISHFEMMKGKKSMYVFLAFPSQNDSIAGHCLFRGFHVLVERLQHRGTGKHWGWVGNP